MLLVPFAASIAFAWVLSGLLPTVSTLPMAILRWILIALASTSVMVGFDRLARRLLPLAALLNLTLAFPDQAPSRFRIAMRTGTTQQLRKVVAEARAGRIGETPTEAAEKLLELVAALSLHDKLTRGHAERVRAYTHMVGQELKIAGAELDHLRWSALLHDIGKLLISAEILNKPGKLTDAEFEVVKQHPELGRELVAPLVVWLGDASRAVWEHHERWDGRGYPRGLSGTDISLAGRIVAVTDAFDVMTSARSYKDPISPVAARTELARCAGSQFDAAIVRAFLNVSLGRLRMAMGPLSWLTQLSFVPQALVTAGASGATAVTAIVGLGAGALGVGLSDDGVISAAQTEQSALPAAYQVDDVIGDPFGAGGTAPGPDDGVGVAAGDDGVGPADGGVGPGDDGVAGTDGPIGVGVGTSTTSSVPTGGQAGSTTSTVPTGTTVAPLPGATTTAPSTNPGATVAPSTTAGPTGGTTAPVTTAPATGPATTPPGTTAPATTAPATTAPPTTPPATTTTTAPLPVAMQDQALYLKSSGSGNVAWLDEPPLPLTTLAPNASGTPNYDTNRNVDDWLTLVPGDPPATGAQRFRWTATAPVRFHGTAGATLWLTGASPGLGGNFVIQVQLRRCTPSGCAIIANRGTSSTGPIVSILGIELWTPATVNFGTIDEVLAAGESLELVVNASGSNDVWLAYDTQTKPSLLDFRQT